MWENEFIKRYNSVIERLKKADAYLQDENIDIDIRTGVKSLKKYNVIDMYNGIIKELSSMQVEYKNKMEKEMEEENKFNGFC